MEVAPFENHHFQMGVTAMGFAVDLGLCYLPCICTYLYKTKIMYVPNITVIILAKFRSRILGK